MSDLVWWTLFAILTLLLVVLIVKLCYRVISDVWCSSTDVSEDAQDIEDLTRYRNDFRTIFKEAQVQDESDRLMMTKEFSFKTEQNGTTPILTTFTEKEKEKEKEKEVEQMHAIAEEEETKSNGINEAKIEIEEDKSSETKESKIGDDKIQIEAVSHEDSKETGEVKTDEEGKDRVDGEEPEILTEEEEKIMNQILGIQNKTDTYAKQIPFCLGGRNHLTYFDINEKFLMNLIGLSSIDCKDNDKLRRRKQMVSLYIQECQNELKKRADVDVL